MIFLISLISFLCNPVVRGALKFPCSADLSMKPSSTDKSGQLSGENPPPFDFFVFKSTGGKAKHIKNDTYSVKINGSSTLQSFLIQARQTTKEGFLLDESRTGLFVRDHQLWKRQGVRYMPCLHTDTITHSNGRSKSSIEVRWQPTDLEHGVQFLVTISKDNDTFWVQWAPKNGRLYSELASIAPKRSTIFDHSSQMTTEQFFGGKSEIFPQTDHSVFTTPALSERQIMSKEITPSLEQGDNELDQISSLNPTTEDSLARIGTDRVVDAFGNKRIILKATTPESAGFDYCLNNTCQNNATCTNLPFQETFDCNCSPQWIGRFCEKVNPCFVNPCQNLGQCVVNDGAQNFDPFEESGNNNNGDFTCKCRPEWSGKLCENACPTYLCQNGGSCTITEAGQYLCTCRAGFTGSKCETAINLCNPNPCQNNGTCSELPDTRFQCQCPKGYMGRRCHRPCQDVYKSCEFWKEQDKCEDMRPSTKFFDINCAWSCDQCQIVNSTIRTNRPLPPILEPFDFILGHWTTDSNNEERFPVKFDSAKNGFNQTLNFLIANVTMFNTPLLNYSCEATNIADPSDTQINIGFMSLKPDGPDLYKAWIWSTANNGLTVIEEGWVKDGQLMLKSSMIYTANAANFTIPKQVKRTFRLHNNYYLVEKVQRINSDGTTYDFIRYYKKSQPYVIY